ncbi:MAG: 50S ribosomal protein L23 [Candidatus Aenigmatarchaeota archaeon]
MATQNPGSSAATSTKGREKKETKKEASEEAWKIIINPLLTEKSIGVVESQNKLTFNVRPGATKRQIRWAVENALAVKVDSINTLIDREGRKRAAVKLAKEFKAADIATRFGML